MTRSHAQWLIARGAARWLSEGELEVFDCAPLWRYADLSRLGNHVVAESAPSIVRFLGKQGQP